MRIVYTIFLKPQNVITEVLDKETSDSGNKVGIQFTSFGISSHKKKL